MANCKLISRGGCHQNCMQECEYVFGMRNERANKKQSLGPRGMDKMVSVKEMKKRRSAL